MIKKEEMLLIDVINHICAVYKEQGEKGVYIENGWCVYSAEKDVTLNTRCYIDDYPEFDDEDNEVYSDYVIDNNLELLFRDEMIQDVVVASLNQKDDASIEEIVKALIYYEENDIFLTL